jgi:hypothetical protein
MMENTSQQPAQKKPLPKKLIIFGLIGFIVFISLVVTGLYIFNQIRLGDTVKVALKAIPEAMEKAKGNDGYPVVLPGSINRNTKVHLEGGGSFDGTVYCVTGTSTEAPLVVYHIDSSSHQPQQGKCQIVANVPTPVVVSNLQRDIVSTGQIKLSWALSTYSVSYTLQCATNDTFSKNIAQTTNSTLTRTCDNLKDGTQYFIRVRGNNALGAGPWSTVLTLTTNSLSVAPPTIKIIPLSPTSISYSFSPINGATQYIIEWATDINFLQNLKSVSQTTISGLASGLKPATQYFFHVKAVTTSFDASHAAFSQEVYVSTPTK